MSGSNQDNYVYDKYGESEFRIPTDQEIARLNQNTCDRINQAFGENIGFPEIEPGDDDDGDGIPTRIR